MDVPFEYDVFLSFSSKDAEIVKPIWQELSHNGIRVFWSDATLRDELGSTWFDVIEKSLEQSKHFILICTEDSLISEWVKREYRAFINHCYRPNSRTLIPLLQNGITVSDLPLFLRDMQTGQLNDPEIHTKLLERLGQTSLSEVKKLLIDKNEEINHLNVLVEELRSEIFRQRKELFKDKENEILELHTMVKKLRTDLNKEKSRTSKDIENTIIRKLKREISELEKKLYEETYERTGYEDR